MALSAQRRDRPAGVERACRRRLSGTAKKLVHNPFHNCHAVKNGSICRRARYSTTKLKSARYELDLHATVCRGRSQARDNVQSPHLAQAGHPVFAAAGPSNPASAPLQRWHGVFCGGLQRDDGTGCGTGVTVGGPKAISLSKSQKMPELLYL